MIIRNTTFRRLLTVTSILMLALVSPVLSAPQELEFTGLAHKVLAGPDTDGDLEISIKVNVRNMTGSDREVKIIVRAVDKEQFEVFDVQLTGKVKARETRTLTDTQFISEKVYNTIVRWEIED